MKSFEEIKAKRINEIRREIEIWKNGKATEDYKQENLARLSNELDNIDEAVRIRIANDARNVAYNIAHNGISHVSVSLSNSYLDLTEDSPELAFARNLGKTGMNSYYGQDGFIRQITSKYGFEVPTIEETEKLQKQYDKLGKEDNIDEMTIIDIGERISLNKTALGMTINGGQIPRTSDQIKKIYEERRKKLQSMLATETIGNPEGPKM